MNATPQNLDAVPADMGPHAEEAASFLKTLAHKGRLMILCNLVQGEKSVGALEELVDIRQANVSQILARLRAEGLVATRREGKTIYYRIADPKVTEFVTMMHGLFCPQHDS